MKKQILSLLNLARMAFVIAAVALVTSCGEDEEPDPTQPIAAFQFEASAENFLTINFTNASADADTYSWNFGDGNTSTDESPSHTYAEAGSYEVTLTASSGDLSSERTETVAVVDPLAASRALFGESGKTWYLIADASASTFPIEVGPVAKDKIWFKVGEGGVKGFDSQQPICERACMFDDAYTFTPDGKMERDLKGDAWAEGGVWSDDMVGCFDTSVSSNWVNANGDDVSAWGSGTYDYEYNAGENTLTIIGAGAYVGLAKVGSEAEFNTPQSEVVYTVTNLVDDANVDTMTIETKLVGDDGNQFGYWSFTLVSYENEGDKVQVELCEAPEPVDCAGDDLSDITPDAIYNNFDGTDPVLLDTTASDVSITYGVDDPAGGDMKVGEYVRGTASFADLKFQLENDVILSNFTTVSVEVYLPSTNDYAGALSDQVDIFIADASCDTEFWTTWNNFQNTDAKDLDTWVTVSFDLGDAATRDDLDLVGLKIGGENHAVDGTFYVRNLKFE